MNMNNRTIKTTFKRIELCDLLLACTALSDQGEKWKVLHDKIANMIDVFDREMEDKQYARDTLKHIFD